MTVERAGRNLEYWAGVMVSLGGQTFFRLTWCRLGLLVVSRYAGTRWPQYTTTSE